MPYALPRQDKTRQTNYGFLKSSFVKFCNYLFIALLLISQNLIFFVRPAYASSQTWAFTTSSDYTYDSTKIEFSSGQAQVKATSSWYNTSWSRRKAITVDNSNNANTLTNYQVLVTVTYDSNMNADFSDIRFTSSDGTTLIDHWLEDSTASTTANFWVEVPSIAASTTTTIYMYYGNSGAADSSSAGNTFAYYDALTDVSGWSTFGTSVTWSVVSDSDRGNVFDATITSANNTGIYKTASLPSTYVVQVYAKDTQGGASGSLGGPLMDMEDSNSWYRPGFSKTAGIVLRDNNNGVTTDTVHSPTATFSQNTWYKTKAVFKEAVTYTINSTILTASENRNVTQGLATDGSFIYSSGSGSANGLAKYDISDGSQDAVTAHSPANEHFGGLELVGAYVYAVVIDYLTDANNVKTYIYRYNTSDLSGETQVADISSTFSSNRGGNALAYKDGYWIVGETGGATSNYNQHFYVFDSNWALVKTIQSPYYKDSGAQDAAFKGNTLYVAEHDGKTLAFNWNPESLDLSLIDEIPSPTGYTFSEGITYDSVNNVFYVQSTSEKKIYSVSLAATASKRIVYSIPDSSNSRGVVSVDFTARTQNNFGVGAYRSQRFSQLIVRQYSFPEPIYSTGSEATLYPTDNPTVRPASALSFTSASAFTETATKNSGEIKYQLSNDAGTTWYWYSSGWTATSAGYTEANTASDINTNIATFPMGSKSFLFRAYLNSDGSQLVQLDSIGLTYINDTSAPTGSISINSGDSNTATRSVTLTISATDDIDAAAGIQMQVSNNSDFSGASWESYTTSKSWTLSSGDGTKTVYVKFKDSAGNTSSAYSDTITLDTTAPNDFDLDSLGDNSYTKDERATFKWKVATTPDATSGLSKYKLEIDNGESGDFTIDSIPTSGTTDSTTDKYVIHYDNFSDSDNSNNYISVYTKSSSQWGSDNNDGKLKEGKKSWKVTAYDNAGNSKEESRTLFVDRTIPALELTQINAIPFKNNLITSNKKPSLSGKFTDPIAGDSSSTSEQTKQDNKVAAGPKNVEVKIEKLNYLGSYDLYSLSTVIITDKYWSKDNAKISDNSKQTSDKYSNFSYTPTDNLTYGKYKITLTGKDGADNAGSSKSFYLTISSFESIATPQEKKQLEEKTKNLKPEEKEKVKEELQITKPSTLPIPAPPKGVSGFFKNILGGITATTGNVFNYFSEVTSYGSQTIGQGLKQPKHLISSLGEWVSYTTTSFGEIVLDKEPTKITDVKVAILNKDSVVIAWKTNHLATSKVNFGETLDYGKDIQSSTKVHDHKIEIAGLKPNTKYFYEVMSQNKNYVYDAHHEFTTPKE